MEPHAGGQLSLRLSAGGERFHIYGTVSHARVDDGIGLRWNWETSSPVLNSAHDTNVRVEFVPVERGVEVVVTHDGLPNEIVRDAYIRGWRRCLEGMHRIVTDSARARDTVSS
jgi:uncharacterized protein YndB with AHSA1/START domain